MASKTRRTPSQGTAGRSPLEELHQRPSFLIRRAHQLAVANFENEVGAHFGLTNTQYGMLMAIASATDVDVAGAARLVGINRASAHMAIRNLEKAGFIKGATDPHDRRRLVVRMTPAGKKLLRDGDSSIDRAQERLLARISPVDRRHLVRILKLMLPPLPTAGSSGGVLDNPQTADED